VVSFIGAWQCFALGEDREQIRAIKDFTTKQATTTSHTPATISRRPIF
jgi:hypothetical protein